MNLYMQALEELLKQAEVAIQSAHDLKALDDYRVLYLGKKSQLVESLKLLGQLPVEERPAAGQKINTIKEVIQKWIDERSSELKKNLIQDRLVAESIDVTLSGRSQGFGSIHPINKTMNELRDIFSQMGFVMLEGPEIENDHYNFTALNVPPLHPARAMQDTFYFADGLLLRTQTSTVQIRAMESRLLPLRMVAMGRVY